MTLLVLEMILMKSQLPVKVILEVRLSEEFQILPEERLIINKNMLYQQDLTVTLKPLFMQEFQTEKY